MVSRIIPIAMATAVAAAGLQAVPASAQAGASSDTSNVITVEAPRARRTGTSSIGAPIETLTARSAVSYRDIDLRSASGRDELMRRVSTAAGEACKWLDEVYPFAQGTPSSGDCRADAIKRARPQVDATIAAAG